MDRGLKQRHPDVGEKISMSIIIFTKKEHDKYYNEKNIHTQIYNFINSKLANEPTVLKPLS